jgi:hypothetical protein
MCIFGIYLLFFFCGWGLSETVAFLSGASLMKKVLSHWQKNVFLTDNLGKLSRVLITRNPNNVGLIFVFGACQGQTI